MRPLSIREPPWPGGKGGPSAGCLHHSIDVSNRTLLTPRCQTEWMMQCNRVLVTYVHGL